MKIECDYIKIYKCNDCANHYSDKPFSELEFCSLESKPIDVDVDKAIPNWCPKRKEDN